MGGSLGTTLKMWDQQRPLAKGYRIVRFDHRGHGASPVPPPPYEIADLAGDVIELLDALGVQRAHYCGLSIGGMVGMWLAAHDPDRVDRLVLMCTSAHMPPPEAWQERIDAITAAGTVDVLADGIVERWLTPAFAAEHPEVREELRAMLVASDVAGYTACAAAIKHMDLRPILPRITAPTLVISGAQDPSTPPEHQQLIADAIPGARLETLSPAAHVAAVERPDEVNALIASHLG